MQEPIIPNRKSSLYTKIFLMMLGVGVVPIVATGFVALYNVSYAHEASVAATETTLVRQKEAELHTIVSAAVGNVFDLVVNFQLLNTNEALNEDTANPKLVLSTLLSSQPRFLRQFLIDEPSLREVSFLAVNDAEVNGRKIHVGLETARFGTLTNGSEEPIPLDTRNLADLPGFIQARAGTLYFSPVSYTLRGPVVSIFSPVKDKNGTVISVLKGELGLEKVLQVVKNTTLGASGYVYLVDQDGFLIAKSDGRPTARTLRFIPLIDDILRGKDHLNLDGERRYQSYFGESVIAAGGFLPNFSNKTSMLPPWGVIVEWPTSDADKVLYDLRNEALLFSSIVLLLVIFLSIFLARRIVRPIELLEEGTLRVAHGKFTTPIRVETGDEIEELGAAFNTMMQGLQELQKLKDEFVFLAAHELKTPVAAIQGYLSLIRGGIAGPIGEKAKQFVEKAMLANGRLVRLVDDLLAVARSEAGQLEIVVQPIVLSDPIQATIRELAPLASEKSIRVTYEPIASLPKVLGDADRVKEVMTNLIGNAIKYGASSGGTIRVAHEIQGGTLVTSVADDGIGISAEAQKKLFQKFYRVRNEKTKNVDGTGLGLFIVRQIIEKMHGQIWVASVEGKGSTFRFSLPIEA